jgi:hypothetical protein
VIRRGGIRVALLAAVTGLSLVLPAGTSHAADAPAKAAGTGIAVNVDTPKRVDLLKKLTIEGSVSGAAPGEVVTITVTASERELFVKKVTAKDDGAFSLPLVVDACCRYAITAENAGQTATDGFSVQVPKHLGKGAITALFNRSLQDQGFHTGTKGSRVTIGTRLAIKAFRKTNGMARREAYSPAIFRKLLEGRGAFKPRYNDGRHVEVDISHQVMSLIEGDVPVHTFHISSGAGGTPTIRGNFRFYLRQAGYNGKRMYYSVYFHGGYATHGYNPVPNGPASHGCVRNPIPFSRFIYNWVEIGMPVHVYG